MRGIVHGIQVDQCHRAGVAGAGFGDGGSRVEQGEGAAVGAAGEAGPRAVQGIRRLGGEGDVVAIEGASKGDLEPVRRAGSRLREDADAGGSAEGIATERVFQEVDDPVFVGA